MRIFWVCITLATAHSAAAAEPDRAEVAKYFHSDYYTVAWGEPATWDASAELEIGDGNGHGGTLQWLRFRPDKDGVEVLSIGLDEGRELVFSKWPCDHFAVSVKRARMDASRYARLLRYLAVVDAAQTTARPPFAGGLPVTTTSNSFWVYSRLTANGKTLVDLNWSGKAGSLHEANYAKPAAAVSVARDATEPLDLLEHALSDDERRWVSAKFTRDWKRFDEAENREGMQLSYWWVRERYLMAVGVAGDASALPALREFLIRAPDERHKHDFAGIDMSASQDREVYYAINAVTRLTKKDVRPQPVEEMDVEATRRKVLDLLPAQK